MLSIFSIKRKVMCGIATVQLNDKERKKMGRGLAKRFISVIITSVMAASLCICIAGCTAINKDEDAENRGGNDTFSDTDNANNSSGDTGMGRYVEKTILEWEQYGKTEVQQMADGQLVMFDSRAGKYNSKDNGDSWELETLDWLEELNQNSYIMGAALSNEGTFIVSYESYSELAQIQEPETTETEETKELETIALEEKINVSYLMAAPDGTQSAMELSLNNTNLNVFNFEFSDSNRLFTYEGNIIYEINVVDGSAKELFTVEGNIRYFQSRGDLMLCVTNDAIFIYDMVEEKIIEDTVLQDFIKDNYGGFQDFGNGFNFYIFLGEENAVYLAGEKGLHRHVIGGSLVEQVIDGSLSSLGNPAHYIRYAALIDNQEFLINYNDGKTVKCTYDATIPTIPNEKLTVYSLKENDTVRQAVFAFQTNNPEIYITYTIGMEGEGITREDALKKLSTELLSGNGPDVLILDNMPYKSYADKGVLMDLSEMVQEMGGENVLFTNLLEALYMEDNLYIVPVEFQIPVVIGHQNTLEMIGDLAGMADALEALRKENPDSKLIQKCSENGIMKSLSIVCAPSWKDADKNGNIDEEAIQEYLMQCKRIYDAQRNGTPKEEIDAYYDLNNLYLEIDGIPYEESEYFNYVTAGDYLCKSEQLVYGVIYDYDSYADVLSAAKIKGFEDTTIGTLNGQSKNVYCPLTLAGINVNTKNSEKAMMFIQTLLGRDVQKLTHNGYPINKKAFEDNMAIDEKDVGPDGVYLTYLMNAEDGSIVTWDAYVLDEEQKQQLIRWIEQADVPYITDVVLEQAVYDSGAKYLDGTLELEDAVKEIVDNLFLVIKEN